MDGGVLSATAGALVVLVLLIARPRLGLAALVLYYPFIDFAVRPPVPGLNAETLLLGFGVGATIARRDASLPSLTYLGPLLAYFSVMVMGWLVTISWYEGSYPLASHWDNFKRLKSVLFPTLAFFLAYGWLDTPSRRLRVIEAISAAVGISALTGLADWILGGSESMRIMGRAAGVFVNPNRLGVLLASFSVVSLSILSIRDVPAWRRVLHGGAYVFALGVVLLTLSRKAWLGVLVAHLVYFALANRTLLMGMILVAALAFTVGYPLLPDLVQERVEETFQPGQTIYLAAGAAGFEASAGQRLALYQAGFGMFAESPLWGHGFYSFVLLSPYYGARYGLVTHRDPHSLPLKVAAENGLIGLSVLAWMSAVLAACGLMVYRRGGSESWLGAVFIATVASLFLANLLGTVMYEHNVSFFFWALFGLVARAEHGRSVEQATVER